MPQCSFITINNDVKEKKFDTSVKYTTVIEIDNKSKIRQVRKSINEDYKKVLESISGKRLRPNKKGIWLNIHQMIKQET